MSHTQAITPHQFKQGLELEGKTIKEWADEHGFSDKLPYVYRALNGMIKCKRGLGHRIAVAAGIKPTPATIQ